MLADHVLRDPLLALRAGAQERERSLDCIDESHRRERLYSRGVKAPAGAGRFAERIVEGRDDGGSPERVVIWIERRAGAVWAVGRQVNPQHRETESPRAGRLRLGGLRARGLPRGCERRARGRCGRLGGRRRRGDDQAVSPRGAARAAREVLLRALVEGHSRFASGIGSPCGSCVGKPSARSMRASSSSEITCSSRSASSCTSSTWRPSVFARYSSSRRWWRITSSATRSPDARQPRAAVGLVLEQSERGELLHHRRRRRRRHRLVLRERADRHAAVLGLELVDALQVVLDRLAEPGLAP